MREAGGAVPRGSTVLLNLSGRGDKDVAQVREMLRGRVVRSLEVRLRALRDDGRKALVPYFVAGVTSGLDAARRGGRCSVAPTPSRSAFRFPIR